MLIAAVVGLVVIASIEVLQNHMLAPFFDSYDSMDSEAYNELSRLFAGLHVFGTTVVIAAVGFMAIRLRHGLQWSMVWDLLITSFAAIMFTQITISLASDLWLDSLCLPLTACAIDVPFLLGAALPLVVWATVLAAIMRRPDLKIIGSSNTHDG